jgi:endonuclease/exonuclease/phosphatase (EEP) superfamily protein YafD
MRLFLLFCCVIALVASLLPIVWPAWLLGDWMDQGRIQLTLGCIIFAMFSVWKRQLAISVVFLLMVIGNILWINNHFSTATCAATHANQPLRVMTMNVWKHNPDLTLAINAIKAADPDIIWLQEVSRDMLTTICTALKTSHPYPHCPAGHKGFYGMGFLSKHPFTQHWQQEQHYDTERSIFHVSFNQTHANKDFIGVYFRSPRDAERLSVRTRQMQHVAEYIAQHPDRHFVVAGDMNSVFWQHDISTMRQSSGLHHAQQGMFSTPLTWNARLPAILRIPIDHIMLQDGLCANGAHIASASGSDHRAIYADILEDDKDNISH